MGVRSACILTAGAPCCLWKVLTLGPLSNEFSARVYEDHWHFVEQGLPSDLIARYSVISCPSTALQLLGHHIFIVV
jgi:hypothetical protein